MSTSIKHLLPLISILSLTTSLVQSAEIKKPEAESRKTPESNLAKTEAAFKNVGLAFETFDEAMEATNAAIALRQMDQFLIAFHSLADQLRGTDVEVSERMNNSLQAIHDALQADDLARAKKLYDDFNRENPNFDSSLKRFFEKQQNTTTAVSSSGGAATFGPVMERVINMGAGSSMNTMLNLATGRLYPPFDDLAGARLKTEATPPIDLIGIFIVTGSSTTSGEKRLMCFLFTIRRPNQVWEEMTPLEVEAKLTQEKKTDIGPPSWRSLPEDGEFPATYLFQTSEGRKGVLQIIGETTKPPGLMIRYKLVRTNAASP